MNNVQNNNILLHAGRPWSEETKQRVREARENERGLIKKQYGAV